MRNFINRLRMKLSRCYGTDELNRVLNIVTLVFCFLGLFHYLRIFTLFAFVLLIYTSFRTFSTNIYKRRAELQKYLNFKAKRQKKKNFRRLVRSERKDYLYFKCPSCKEYLRVPRHRGKIVVTCRVCGKKIDKKT